MPRPQNFVKRGVLSTIYLFLTKIRTDLVSMKRTYTLELNESGFSTGRVVLFERKNKELADNASKSVLNALA